ncbi:MAG TPA: NUDIX hydrolase [Caulobacteraceae bacterium]|jgi:8-oxo-dGTP pyrophosphatase MutT (NUDIX family)
MAWGKAARTDEGFGLQYAVLPWREGQGGREVLLITSRETGRWVLPKGWPMKKLPPWKAAAREGFEEAGVRGDVAREPIGAYSYLKAFTESLAFRCEVQVFPMKVKTELSQWPEKAERTRRWFTPAAAADAVDEPELQALIRSWAAA